MTIENSDEFLSVVANWEDRWRLGELVKQWETECNKMGGQFSGNLWGVMTQRVLTHSPRAFSKLFRAIMARKNQKAKISIGRRYEMANSASSGLPEEWGKPSVGLMLKSEEAEQKPLDTKYKKASKAESW
jgi:hypothetical protein